MSSASIVEGGRSAPRPSPVPPAVARAVALGLARRLIRDPLSIVEGPRRLRFGPASTDAPTIRVGDERLWPMVVTGGSAGLGEAYIRGWWSTDDLTAALRVLARAEARTEQWRSAIHRLSAPVRAPRRARRGPDPRRDRNNIAAHYDLGNEFFELLLDPTMMYSSAWFETPAASLEDASTAKLDRLCRSIGLEPGMRVVEIGTGWGGFAIHAARHYGVRVTTTTISREQFLYATERVRTAGLEQQIVVLDRDYRDLTGSFERVVSIEMIEAVDWRDVDGYFAACASLLEPGGLMGLQAILVDDDRHERAKENVDFIKAFIFPGGCLPSFGSIGDAAGSAGLRLSRSEWFGGSYAETLRRWRANLYRNESKLAGLGLDAQFVRMWDFYLSYCEAGFEERSVDVAQIVLEKMGS